MEFRKEGKLNIDYNDLPRIEGIRDFMVDQIYEKVFPYMKRQGLFQNGIYKAQVFAQKCIYLGFILVRSEDDEGIS